MTIKPGWCIRDEYGLRHHETGDYTIRFSWWYGPDHSWGTTWGSPDLAQTWPTRDAAESAAAKTWGVGWRFDPRRDIRRKAQKHADAVAESEARQAAYEARVADEANR